MGCRAAGGPMTSSKIAAIFGAIKNCQKTLKLDFFDAGHVEYEIIKHFAAVVDIFCIFQLKGSKNVHFSSKMA